MTCKIKISRTLIFLIISSLLFFSCKKVSLPGVTTGTVTRIMQSSAYCGGQVTGDGGAFVTARGVCWSVSAEPTVGNSKTTDSTGIGLFTSYLTGLSANTLYYVRAYATNREGTVYGDQVTFTTLAPTVPVLTTSGLKSLTLTSASSVGDILNDGGVPVTDRGVCWNTTGSPTIAGSHTSDGAGTDMFTSILTDLSVGTTYYVRSYATNSQGTGYSNQITFVQMEPVTDHDGNAYSVVTIGTQIWMGENLRTTTYNDGNPIPNIVNGREWANLSTPAYAWYNNSETAYKIPYGAIYNWYAASTGKLCPVGWHVPTDAEFTTLIDYLGGDKIAGGKLKEAGTNYWITPNLGATNGSGFTALPAGGRYNIYSEGGSFADLGTACYLWSSTAYDPSNGLSRDIAYHTAGVNRNYYPKGDGESVRCIKNN
jgi:uncharacterized protein (TIGR02145 family)